MQVSGKWGKDFNFVTQHHLAIAGEYCVVLQLAYIKTAIIVISVPSFNLD